MLFITGIFTSMTIASVIDISLSVSVHFFFSGNSRSTASTFEYSTKVEVFSSPDTFWRNFHSDSYLIIEFLCDERFIISFVPITTPLWIFKFSVVKGWLENSEDHTKHNLFSISRSESLGVDEFPYLPSTKSFISYSFKHLFDIRGSLGVDLDMTFFSTCFSSYY